MLPGPLYMYECPGCKTAIARESLMSGNTFGSVLYSDGKRIAPMLPEYPIITKCKTCDTIFWLPKLKHIGTANELPNDNPKWKDAAIAKFLSIHDHFRALDSGLADNRDDELYIRQQILWAFNDQHREGARAALRDDTRYSENINALMALLDTSNPEDHILLAELYRYQRQFETCMKILNESLSSEFDWLKDSFRKECGKGNAGVFKIEL